MRKVDPTQGGCWFCHTDEGIMHFTMEWDAYFHLKCLLDNLTVEADGFYDFEAVMIAHEYDLMPAGKNYLEQTPSGLLLALAK